LDSYIIRIYRRCAGGGRELAGFVERIGNGKGKAFGSSDELWAFPIDRESSRRTGTSHKQRGKAQP
jgi:hypothetical protein